MKRYKVIEPVTKPRFATVSPVRVLPNPKLGPIRPIGTPAIHDPPRGTDFVPDRRPGVPDPAPGILSPVLIRDQLIAETNTFSGRTGPRLANGPNETAFKLPAVPLVMPDHVAVPVAYIEATAPLGSIPRIVVQVLRFDSASRVTVGEPQIVRGPLAKPTREIWGTQATAVTLPGGPRMLAASTIQQSTGSRQIWVVDIAPDGTPTVSVVLWDFGGRYRLEDCGPAIAATDGGGDAFLAWATQEGGRPGIRAGRLVSTRPGRWRLTSERGGIWPVRHPAEPRTFETFFRGNLSAAYDTSRGEYVLAACKNMEPFLALYDGDGNRLRVPQAYGENCSEDPHGNVQLLIHPVTGRASLKVHHNYLYFERGAGGQWLWIDSRGAARTGTTEDCTISDPFPEVPVREILRARGDSWIVPRNESTHLGIAAAPDAEFAVAATALRGAGAGLPTGWGSVVSNVADWADPRLFVSVDHVWGGDANDAVMNCFPVPRLGAQVVLVQRAGELGERARLRLSVVTA